MNKYIIGVIILVLVVAVFLSTFSKTEDASARQVSSTITVVEESHDLGDIDIFGGKVVTTYVLRNDGLEDVTVLSGLTSCMCTEGEIGGLVFGMHESSGKTVMILAGEEKIVTATFDPLAHGPNGTGKVTRELFLKTNSTERPEIKLIFSGNVIENKAH